MYITMIDTYVKLFNLVFTSGKVPISWTTGEIKPIYKNKGDRTEVENYRPTALLSPVSKVVEKEIQHQVYNYMMINNLCWSPLNFLEHILASINILVKKILNHKIKGKLY